MATPLGCLDNHRFAMRTALRSCNIRCCCEPELRVGQDQNVLSGAVQHVCTGVECHWVECKSCGSEVVRAKLIANRYTEKMIDRSITVETKS